MPLLIRPYPVGKSEPVHSQQKPVGLTFAQSLSAIVVLSFLATSSPFPPVNNERPHPEHYRPDERKNHDRHP